MVETADEVGRYKFSDDTQTEYIEFKRRLQSGQRNNVTRAANNIKNNPRKLSTMQPPHKDCVKWRYPEDFGLRTRKEIYEFRPTHARGIYVIVDENMVICFLKAAKQMRFFTMPEWPYHGRKG